MHPEERIVFGFSAQGGSSGDDVGDEEGEGGRPGSDEIVRMRDEVPVGDREDAARPRP